MEKIILGIDPGTNIMGYGLIKVVGNKAEMISMGVIDLRKFPDPYLKLGHIFERVTGIIDSYLPDEMAIEAPFFDAQTRSCPRHCHSCCHPSRHTHSRICPPENQDGNNRTGTGIQGAGGRHVATSS